MNVKKRKTNVYSINFTVRTIAHHFLFCLNMVMSSEPSFLSIKEFANELGVHHTTIRRCIARGRISAIRVGGIKKSIYRIPRTELQRLAIKDLEYIIEKIIEKRTQDNPKVL